MLPDRSDHLINLVVKRGGEKEATSQQILFLLTCLFYPLLEKLICGESCEFRYTLDIFDIVYSFYQSSYFED